MPFVAATRSVGRAGLFTLSVIRASRPGADLFREFVREIYKIGARSLPIIAVGGAFVGLSITLLGYRALDTYGASSQISALVGLGLYRELAPVLTALLFIGRAGSSIAAELGLMRATDQITALGLRAIAPVAKVVAPRFWAAIICVPLLTAIFCSLAISAAQNRGATALPTGSIAISPSAVIWSVARISPSSAAIDEPARPMNSSAVSTGASSR